MCSKDKAPGRANDSRSSARHRGRGVEGRRGNVCRHSVNSTMQTFGFGYTPREVERGEAITRATIAFVRSNPAAWAWACSETARLVAAGERVSVQAIAEAIRAGEATGQPVQINNDFRPVLARLLVLSVPGASLRIERRSCVLDVIDLRGIWEGARHE